MKRPGNESYSLEEMQELRDFQREPKNKKYWITTINGLVRETLRLIVIRREKHTSSPISHEQYMYHLNNRKTKWLKYNTHYYDLEPHTYSPELPERLQR
jgi:hypothetical protein